MQFSPMSMNIEQVERWIDDLGLKPIRESHPVQRLKNIRFLGTMKYVTELKYHYNRYEHSLNVAQIAHKIGSIIHFPDDIQRTVVTMALLHDIGHMPFSHASEIFFRQTWGKYHTAHSSRLAQHLAKRFKLTSKPEMAHLITEANALLNEHDKTDINEYSHLIREIFHGVLSADTLDGITRAAESIGIDYPAPGLIIDGFILENGKLHISSSYLAAVVTFLRLKNYVYNDYVYSTRGMAAEAMLTRALELCFKGVTDKNDFLALDDNEAINIMSTCEEARKLLDQLDNRSLYCSLRDASIDKYKLATALLFKFKSEVSDIKQLKSGIEELIAQEINTQNNNIIVHKTIKLTFSNTLFSQQNLLSTPISIKDISNEFKTTKN